MRFITKKRHTGISTGENRFGWILTTPSILLISVLVFIPMVQSFWTSLHSGLGNNLTFVGFDNYVRMFSDATFIKAAGNTLLYLFIQVPIMIILSLFIASVLNDRKLKFKAFFRTAIFLPCITSLVAYSLVMKSLFQPNGLLNQLLMGANLIDSPIYWFTDSTFAKILIIIAITWRWTGYNMIFYLSGMQNIDPSIYEAADIDGASPFTKFTQITVPMLKPIILFTTITSTIGTLQLFDEVRNLTMGGPANGTTTLSLYIYDLCFKFSPNFGYAAAISFVIVIAIVVLSVIQMKVGGNDD